VTMNQIDQARLFLVSQTPILSMLANPVVLERFWMEYRKNSNTRPVLKFPLWDSGRTVAANSRLAGAQKRNIHSA